MYSKYIGIPYAKAHCWQLVALIQKEMFCITVPMFEDINPDNIKAVASVIKSQQCERSKWQALAKPKHGCIVLMHRGGVATHAGVYIKTDIMAGVIHTSREASSHFTHFNQLCVNWNVTGYYMPIKGAIATGSIASAQPSYLKLLNGALNNDN